MRNIYCGYIPTLTVFRVVRYGKPRSIHVVHSGGPRRFSVLKRYPRTEIRKTRRLPFIIIFVSDVIQYKLHVQIAATFTVLLHIILLLLYSWIVKHCRHLLTPFHCSTSAVSQQRTLRQQHYSAMKLSNRVGFNNSFLKLHRFANSQI